jgi:pimeloyl-ACP methyl ester carboxylesterase
MDYAGRRGNRDAGGAPMKPPRSTYHDIRGLRYHVREWGAADAPLLVMLHGWMDVSASFQFVVDALARDWHVVAPDWRGFGRSARSGADSYWFPDYLADLDALLELLSPQEPVRLLGHSMGGNVALLYGGVRPTRVSVLLNLEGFGLRDAVPTEAPARYAQWLDELRQGASLRDYASLDDVAARLMRNNARLPQERARFLAEHWSEPDGAGRWRIAGDPAHRIVNPVLYRWSENAACWARITAPVLWMEGAQTGAGRWAGARAEIDARRALLRDCTTVVIAAAGHMLHHDQPEAVAAAIEDFLAARAP